MTQPLANSRHLTPLHGRTVGSKVLHHVLPDLVPPIDRQYTFKFFYGRTLLSIPEEVAFAVDGGKGLSSVRDGA